MGVKVRISGGVPHTNEPGRAREVLGNDNDTDGSSAGLRDGWIIMGLRKPAITSMTECSPRPALKMRETKDNFIGGDKLALILR